jgi:hypothetical protein
MSKIKFEHENQIKSFHNHLLSILASIFLFLLWTTMKFPKEYFTNIDILIDTFGTISLEKFDSMFPTETIRNKT